MNYYGYVRLQKLRTMLLIWQRSSCALCGCKSFTKKSLVRCQSSVPAPFAHLLAVKQPSEVSKSDVEKIPKLTEEELDEMYQKKLYNSEFWKQVIKRQIQKYGPKKGRFHRPNPIQDDNKQVAQLSYAAQRILEDSGWWRGKLSIDVDKEQPLIDIGIQPESTTDTIVYPFAIIKPTNATGQAPALSELEEWASKEDMSLVSSEKTQEDQISSDITELRKTLKDLEARVAPEQASKYGELAPLLDPNYSETIELRDPYQPEISNKTVERINRFKMQAFYGSPNPDIPITDMPCGGCGALLHCQDSSIPGYLPSESLENLTRLELQDTICQRCSFLKIYDVALNVSVAPDDYVRIISEIQDKKALAVLLVDLLDFPCSIWPGIIDIIGPQRPIIVVGNKVDLLPKDERGYLERIKECLQEALRTAGIDTGKNIKHMCLVSAKTGYGIEELITQIQNHWGIAGDIYVIGCTNVGKSSLFNALLQSDLCKSQAVDLVQRATVSAWPGKIGLTFQNNRLKMLQAASLDPFKMSLNITADLPLRRLKKFDDQDPDFAKGKWFYDTPGAVHHDQIINLLTLSELSHTIPRSTIKPRCIVIKPSQTFFLAGLARIDYVEGSRSLNFLLYSSDALPTSIIFTKQADEYYEKYLGTQVLKVPFGGPERLKDFPALVPKEMNFTSTNIKECCGDIVLSSAGWVSVNLQLNETVKFLAYTPEGRGCYSREPALLKHAIKLRGKRILGTPFCHPSKFAD